MNVTINKRIIGKRTNKNTKHTWLEQEDRLCSHLYLHGKSYLDAHSLLPHILSSSIKYKFQNCLFLDKGKVKGSMAHCSKQHVRVFAEQRELLLSHILSSPHK